MANRVILLVEDNPGDVKMIRRALKRVKLDHELVSLQDGSEALDYLFGTGKYAERETRAMPQFILLDLSLPFVSGLEVLQQLRAQESTKYLPVVVFTSSREQADMLSSYASGANGFVTKPIELDAFTEIVQQTGVFWYNINEIPLEI